MGTPGRPKHPAAREAAELLEQGMSVREVAATLCGRGINMSISTICLIRQGVCRKAPSLVADGERRLASAVRCPVCRDLIVIVPCRNCGVSWPAELDELERVAERRAAAMGQQRPG